MSMAIPSDPVGKVYHILNLLGQAEEAQKHDDPLGAERLADNAISVLSELEENPAELRQKVLEDDRTPTHRLSKDIRKIGAKLNKLYKENKEDIKPHLNFIAQVRNPEKTYDVAHKALQRGESPEKSAQDALSLGESARMAQGRTMFAPFIKEHDQSIDDRLQKAERNFQYMKHQLGQAKIDAEQRSLLNELEKDEELSEEARAVSRSRLDIDPIVMAQNALNIADDALKIAREARERSQKAKADESAG